MLAALLISGVAWRTLRQKRQADNRSEWWRRTQWALEAAASEDAVMIRYGNEMLQLLADSDMANDEDRLVLDAVWEGTKTHLEPNDIEQLINDVAERELTEEQRSSVEGYVDDSQSSGDNKLTKEDRND